MAGNRDPFASLRKEPGQPVDLTGKINVDEVPMEPLAAVEQLRGRVPGMTRRPSSNTRTHPRRPAERRRQERKITVTFSVGNEDVIDRLRAVALQRDMLAPDNKSPNVSAVIEFLILNGYSLEDLEQDKVPADEAGIEPLTRQSGQPWA